MALLTFGLPEARRSYVLAMRMAATARGTRPFDGPQMELVKMFAGLVGCAGCHGLEQSLNFSELLGPDEPWPEVQAGIAQIAAGLPDLHQRQEAVHAALMVALYSPVPDPQATTTARWIGQELGVKDDLMAMVERIAHENAAEAKGDIFRRMLSQRTPFEQEQIANQMAIHDLASLSDSVLTKRFHELVEQADEGSVGAEMKIFYQTSGFEMPGKEGSPLPVEFLAVHDLHHVLAGYGTSPHGEVYTAVFNAANSPEGIGWLTVVLIQWHQGIKMGVFPPAHAHLNPKEMARAADRGAQLKEDICTPSWDWLSLLNQPLDQVRESLNITTCGYVKPGDNWHQ
ncbi:MAG: hypothetical protein WCI65_09385 [Synechococcaceae cyanobacterium ELA263]